MTNDFDPEQTANEVARVGIQVLEAIMPVLETIEGYKKELERLGYSPEAREQMAVDLHHMMMYSMSHKGDADG